MFAKNFVDALQELLEAFKKIITVLRDLQNSSPEEYDKFVKFSTDPAAGFELMLELSEKDPEVAAYFLNLIRKLGELQTYLTRIYFTTVEEKEKAIALIEEINRKLEELEKKLQEEKK